jgi:hypothetical protein
LLLARLRSRHRFFCVAALATPGGGGAARAVSHAGAGKRVPDAHSRLAARPTPHTHSLHTPSASAAAVASHPGEPLCFLEVHIAQHPQRPAAAVAQRDITCLSCRANSHDCRQASACMRGTPADTPPRGRHARFFVLPYLQRQRRTRHSQRSEQVVGGVHAQAHAHTHTHTHTRTGRTTLCAVLSHRRLQLRCRHTLHIHLSPLPRPFRACSS